MKVVDHGTDAQDVDAILLFDCKEDGQEHKEVPPGVKDDDPVDRSLVNVVDGISAESSFFHCSVVLEHNNMDIIPEFVQPVDNLCCFRGYFMCF
jgi:hypothetical protein